LPPFSLYRALRRLTPRRISITCDAGFFRSWAQPRSAGAAADGKVTIRPIAGTRPRGKTPEEDKALAKT